jgi:hypothetical protein
LTDPGRIAASIEINVASICASAFLISAPTILDKHHTQQSSNISGGAAKESPGQLAHKRLLGMVSVIEAEPIRPAGGKHKLHKLENHQEAAGMEIDTIEGC